MEMHQWTEQDMNLSRLRAICRHGQIGDLTFSGFIRLVLSVLDPRLAIDALGEEDECGPQLLKDAVYSFAGEPQNIIHELEPLLRWLAKDELASVLCTEALRSVIVCISGVAQVMKLLVRCVKENLLTATQKESVHWFAVYIVGNGLGEDGSAIRLAEAIVKFHPDSGPVANLRTMLEIEKPELLKQFTEKALEDIRLQSSFDQHNNDKQDYRNVTLLPTLEEIKLDGDPWTNQICTAVIRCLTGFDEITWQTEKVIVRYNNLHCDNPVDSFLVLRSMNKAFHYNSYDFITLTKVNKADTVYGNGEMVPSRLLDGMRPGQRLELYNVKFSSVDLKAIELVKSNRLWVWDCEMPEGGVFRYPLHLTELTVWVLKGDGHFNQRLLNGMKNLEFLQLNSLKMSPDEGNRISLRRCYNLNTIRLSTMTIDKLEMPSRTKSQEVMIEVYGSVTIEGRSFLGGAIKLWKGKFNLTLRTDRTGKMLKWPKQIHNLRQTGSESFS